jgi:hypothetical protein
LPSVRRLALLVTALLSFAAAAWPQAIEFENGGLKYQTLTRKGVTVMFTRMVSHLHEYAMWQVAVSNGSDVYWNIKPEDFSYQRTDGKVFQAVPARDIVEQMLERGSHADMVKLITSYENALYGIPHMKISNGYEQRRQNAMAEGISAKFKAAAAASAVVLVPARVGPGQSTDGAIFIPGANHQVTNGKIVVHTQGEVFEFNPDM